MKVILLIFSISILIASCQVKEPEASKIPDGYIKHEIVLKNDLGKFEIYLHPDLDTNYFIVHISDISTADRYLELFSKKTFQVPSDKTIDSVYNLSISQPRRPLDESVFFNINGIWLYYSYTNVKAMFPKVSFSELKLIRISNREIENIAYKPSLGTSTTAYIESAIIISGQLIVLRFNCYCSDCSDFITKMNKSIYTIKVTQEQNSPIKTLSSVNRFYNYWIEYIN